MLTRLDQDTPSFCRITFPVLTSPTGGMISDDTFPHSHSSIGEWGRWARQHDLASHVPHCLSELAHIDRDADTYTDDPQRCPYVCTNLCVCPYVCNVCSMYNTQEMRMHTHVCTLRWDRRQARADQIKMIIRSLWETEPTVSRHTVESDIRWITEMTEHKRHEKRCQKMETVSPYVQTIVKYFGKYA